jgi:hypothetical protein
MRYPDGGGLSAEGRARREKLRLQAAQMFQQEIKPVQVARSLRVSAKSAYQWRRCWRTGGEAGLASGDGVPVQRAAVLPGQQQRVIRGDVGDPVVVDEGQQLGCSGRYRSSRSLPTGTCSQGPAPMWTTALAGRPVNSLTRSPVRRRLRRRRHRRRGRAAH